MRRNILTAIYEAIGLVCLLGGIYALLMAYGVYVGAV